MSKFHLVLFFSSSFFSFSLYMFVSLYLFTYNSLQLSSFYPSSFLFLLFLSLYPGELWELKSVTSPQDKRFVLILKRYKISFRNVQQLCTCIHFKLNSTLEGKRFVFSYSFSLNIFLKVEKLCTWFLSILSEYKAGHYKSKIQCFLTFFIEWAINDKKLVPLAKRNY